MKDQARSNMPENKKDLIVDNGLELFNQIQHIFIKTLKDMSNEKSKTNSNLKL